MINANAAEMIAANGGSASVVGGGMQINRAVHTATLLTCVSGPCGYDSQVVIAGGMTASNSGPATTAEIFNPATGTFTLIGPSAAGVDARAVRLNTGAVLIAGAYGASTAAWDSGERFHPATSAFAAGTNGQFYSATVAGVGPSPYNFTIRSDGLPSLLALNVATGTITGTPTTVGIARSVVEITDAAGHQVLRQVTIQVKATTGGGETIVGPGGGPGGSLYGPLYCSAPNSYARGFEVDTNQSYALTSGFLLCNDNTVTPKFGGGTEPDTFVACSPGDRMVGFLGTIDGGANYGVGDPVVTSVGARCLTAGGGSIYSTGQLPGGGPAFGPFDCPEGKVVVGVQGGNGAVVDRIEAICAVRP